MTRINERETIMRWRDIRFEKPTVGQSVIELFHDKRIGVFDYELDDEIVAWMPESELPKFDPVPDLPEGWRFVDKSEPCDSRAMYWDVFYKKWGARAFKDAPWTTGDIYIVPIDPPKPDHPPVPEGYRLVDNLTEPLSDEAMYWSPKNCGEPRPWPDKPWIVRNFYIVPINPKPKPEKKYRPFKDAAEFEPHELKFWRYKTCDHGSRHPPVEYSNFKHGSQSWYSSLMDKEFADGTPFGVEVKPDKE